MKSIMVTYRAFGSWYGKGVVNTLTVRDCDNIDVAIQSARDHALQSFNSVIVIEDVVFIEDEIPPQSNNLVDLKKMWWQVDNIFAADIETTGLSPTGDRIIEVAFAKLENKIFQPFKSYLINPEIPIPYHASKVNGISDDMVKDKPTFKEVAQDILDGCYNNSVLIFHNAPFDSSFLMREMDRALGIRSMPPSICTLKISRKLYPKNPKHKLEVMLKLLKIEAENTHRAMDDAMAAGKLFQKLGKSAGFHNLTLGDIYRGRY